jgi:hypothetical protein
MNNEQEQHQPFLNSYKMLTILNAGNGGISSCKISGLQKYTTYEFFIVPFYKTVEGKPSNSRVSQTSEDGKINLCKINNSNITKIYSNSTK